MHLYDEVKVAEVIIAGGRGVASSNDLAVDFSGDRDVLSRRKAEIVLRIG
jgi:hypothetical protein